MLLDCLVWVVRDHRIFLSISIGEILFRNFPSSDSTNWRHFGICEQLSLSGASVLVEFTPERTLRLLARLLLGRIKGVRVLIR
jgi:hypothetical protein